MRGSLTRWTAPGRRRIMPRGAPQGGASEQAKPASQTVMPGATILSSRRRGALATALLLLVTLSVSGCGPQDPSNVNNTSNTTTGRTDMGGGEDMGGEDMSAPAALTVASFNVRFLFDTTCDSGRCGSGQFEQLPSGGELEARIAQLQDAIRTLDADVIIFQEIETRELFDQLTSSFAQEYPTREFGETGGSASLDVGIISRWSFAEVRRHKADTVLTTSEGARTSFARELLEVHVTRQGKRAIIFGAHLTSKSSDSTGERREAEADKAAQIALASAGEFPGALVVVGGDLNDTPDSAPLMRMVTRGMTNTADGQPADTYFSYIYQGRRQVIDHLLFVPHDGVGYDRDAMTSFHDNGDGFAGSDHGAVRARFVWY